MKKSLLKNLAKFTEKHLCSSFFFNKAERLRSATLLKKRHQHRCLLVNTAKFLRTPFKQNTSERLLLKLTLAIITSFSWKLKLSQLNYFTGCFCNYSDSPYTFTKRKTPKIIRTTFQRKTRESCF